MRPNAQHLCYLFLLFTPCLHAGELRHDPFSRPLLVTPSASVNAALTSEAAPEPPWSPRLTAVLVAGKNSIANVDGTILRIGESLDGYRLVKVRENEAIFYKAKKRVVLRMDTPTLKAKKERGQ